MRIVQIIDSLEAGGAERMAVNYANALANTLPFSALVATRKEGSLKEQLSDDVEYLFLNKQKAVDWPAAFRLKKFCKSHDIDWLHAHSSSFFIAVMVKLLLPRIKIIWHDHDGMSEFLEQRKTVYLNIASYFFSGIISVNDQLKRWAERKLNCKKVIYIANFTDQGQEEQQTFLSGNEGKRILCLANLRPQKNHLFLIAIANLLKETHPEWSFHLVGKDFNDDYAETIKQAIIKDKLEGYVQIYGSKNDTGHIISQSEIAVLTSKSEGLPVSLLEYGYHKKAVVVTNVGEIPTIIHDRVNGIIVDKEDINQFYSGIVTLIEDEVLRKKLGKNLYMNIADNYSEKSVIKKYLNLLQSIKYEE